MGSKQELIKTENGTALGMPVMIDGRRALLVKAGRHFDILTPEKAAALIAGVPVKQIIYQDPPVIPVVGNIL